MLRNHTLRVILLIVIISEEWVAATLFKNAISSITDKEIEKLIESVEDIPKLNIIDALFNGDVQQVDYAQFTLGQKNEDVLLNITQLIKKYGYPVEQHKVHTKDGYILTLFRIPSNGCPVLVQHGFICSSDDFLTVGPQSALPYMLAEKGYDVWLGNSRGNKHSQEHEYLSVDSDEYWDFSWNEMGLYDQPAVIDYILKVTGREKLQYIGHSQGTTIFFVMCAERPEYNNKVSFMVALAAVAWMSHVISPPFRLLAPAINEEYIVARTVGVRQFMPSNSITKILSSLLCGDSVLAGILCSNYYFIAGGFDYNQLNITNYPVIVSHQPGGSSVKQFVHFCQIINADKFRKFDYGPLKNLKKYGSINPPDYPVDKITVPIAIFHGDNDFLSSYTDLKKLLPKLHKVAANIRVADSFFAHFDYFWAKDIKQLVYDKILKLMEQCGECHN